MPEPFLIEDVGHGTRVQPLIPLTDFTLGHAASEVGQGFAEPAIPVRSVQYSAESTLALSAFTS
jgi:hypothetical protein